MSASDTFDVDVDQLTLTIDQMAACGAALHDLADLLARRLASLHLTWGGASAEAHSTAQAAWEAGFSDTREALAQMRAAARTARTSYTSAADTNLRMWQQVD